MSLLSGIISYGTYTAAGICTQLGTMSGIASQPGQEATSVVMDPELGVWFATTQYDSRLYYGNYDIATGQPTIVGYLSGVVPGINGANGIVIDPDLRLWWVCNDDQSTSGYGTYDASGVPTVSGTQAMTGVPRTAVAIEPGRQRLWWADEPYVYEYDETGVISPTAIPYPAASLWRGAVDSQRSVVVAPSNDRSSYVLYDLASDGTLATIDSLAAGASIAPYANIAVDPAHGLALCANGHMISYCN
jgi:hypothetical protein